VKNHEIWMLAGCVLPLLLIFILPAFGTGSTLTLIIVVVLMLGCHLFMGHHQGMHEEDGDGNSKQHKHS
jgi:hypothetical protein